MLAGYSVQLQTHSTTAGIGYRGLTHTMPDEYWALFAECHFSSITLVLNSLK